MDIGHLKWRVNVTCTNPPLSLIPWEILFFWQVFNERQLKLRKTTENCMAMCIESICSENWIFCGIFTHVAMRMSVHFFRIHFKFYCCLMLILTTILTHFFLPFPTNNNTNTTTIHHLHNHHRHHLSITLCICFFSQFDVIWKKKRNDKQNIPKHHYTQTHTYTHIHTCIHTHHMGSLWVPRKHAVLFASQCDTWKCGTSSTAAKKCNNSNHHHQQ